jgi:ubiquinone/menaquinone biosynthesis C-methylase UbiE
MSTITTHNDEFIAFWNDVLVNKFERYRNILMDGMSHHSTTVLEKLQLPDGARVLDVGCGWGDTALTLAQKVGANGSVVGLDCCDAFLTKGRNDAIEAGLNNVSFIADDAQCYPFEPVYDLCFSRFGMMFFSNPVAAMQNIHHALKPGGELLFITWRQLHENPWLSAAREAVLQFLPPAGDDAQVCGPGPFSMSNPEVVIRQLQVAGYSDISVEPIDGPVTAGDSLDQAVAFQLAIGPAGEIFREAGEMAERRRPMIEYALHEKLAPYQDSNGKVIMDSASWVYRCRKAS